MRKFIDTEIQGHLDIVLSMRDEIHKFFETVHPILTNAVKSRQTIFFCGNGGSAADSQHLAAELVGRFKFERGALPALALSTDTSVLTCVANDYSYGDIFSRQIQAHGNKGDILMALSTSGDSENVVNAIKLANQLEMTTISFLGKQGGQASIFSKYSIIVKSNETARIQELHIMLGHIMCGLIDEEFQKNEY